MTASFLWAWLGTDAPWYGLAAMAALMLAGVAYIARFPRRPRADPPAHGGLGPDRPSCDDA